MIRVLVADDEALVRDGLRAIAELEADITVVGEAGDGVTAVRQARELRPDIVLMDVQMPGMDGIEATGRILAGPRPPRVIVLTTFDRNEYVYAALRAGASGFLLKDVRRGQLVEAIKGVMAGDQIVAPAITRRLIEAFCQAPEPSGGSPAALAGLTAREREVLELVGQGLTNAEIGRRLFVAETTVKTHVGRLLDKLELRDRTQAVIVAYETGLVRAGGERAAPPS